MVRKTLASIRAAIVLPLIAAGCGGGPEDPARAVLAMGYVIEISRDATHPFIADYDRTLKLLRDDSLVAERKMFRDTGGYSRANLYRISSSRYVVRSAFDVYLVDVAEGQIAELEGEAGSGEFVGAFDTGGARRWRFIPAEEREELSVAPRGG